MYEFAITSVAIIAILYAVDKFQKNKGPIKKKNHELLIEPLNVHKFVASYDKGSEADNTDRAASITASGSESKPGVKHLLSKKVELIKRHEKYTTDHRREVMGEHPIFTTKIKPPLELFINADY